MKFLIITLATFGGYLVINACAMLLTWFANTVSLWGILAVVALIVLTVAHQRRKKKQPWTGFVKSITDRPMRK